MKSTLVCVVFGAVAAPVLAQHGPPLPPPPRDNPWIRDAALPTMVSRPNPTKTPSGLLVTPAPPKTVGPDGASVDSIVTALYQSVSCGPEVEPNWDRLRALFLPGAVILPPRRNAESPYAALDAAAFQDRVHRLLESWKQKGESTALYESEIARKEDCFGNVCQVFSTFETRHAPSDETPLYRGIHSLQLVRDGSRWRIASLIWDGERADNPIPPEYGAK